MATLHLVYSISFRVNPIVGCVEPARPSPFEGMSEEQKEHEAMKLVSLINDLQNMGVVQPAVPGPDGKPRPAAHVLELRDAVNQLSGARDEDHGQNSDSDD